MAVITTYTYECGCQMGRIKADEINDVKINCDQHRRLLQAEIKKLAAMLSLLIRKNREEQKPDGG